MITETEIRNLDKIKDEFSEPKKWLLLVAWLKKLTNNMSNLLKLKKEIIEVKKENKVLETEIKLDKWERWKQLSCKKTESKEKSEICTQINVVCEDYQMPIIHFFLSEINSIGMEVSHETKRRYDFDKKAGYFDQINTSIKALEKKFEDTVLIKAINSTKTESKI